MQTQLSYCLTGDGSDGGCTNQMAQFMVTKDSGGYIPVNPTSWTGGNKKALVCGAVDTQVWGQPYPLSSKAYPAI